MPSSSVKPQWLPSEESPWSHQPGVEFAHQFQPVRTSVFAAQKAPQSAHCACAIGNVLRLVGLPFGPASSAISPTLTLIPFARAQATSAVQASLSTVELAEPRPL